MSIDCYDAEPATIWQETRVRANKEHQCSACEGPIPGGHIYVLHKIFFDGRWSTVKRCLRCDFLYHTLNDKLLAASDGDAAADVRLNCGHTYEEQWNEPPPPELARLAFMTPDEMQAEFGGT